MFKFLRRHRTFLLMSLAACIIGLPFFGIGGNFFLSSPQDVIVKINGEKITQAEYDRFYNQVLKQRPEMTPDQRKRLTGEVFQEMIRREVFYQEAKRYGIRVTDQELQMHLASLPAFQKDGQFDARVYFQTVTQVFGIPLKEFEKSRKKDLAGQKLNLLIASSVQIDEETFKQAVAQRLSLETDPKKKKEIQEKPEQVRNEIRNQQVNIVFADWLNQLNSKLQVTVTSESFRKRLSGAS